MSNKNIKKRNIGGYWINDSNDQYEFSIRKIFNKDFLFYLIFILIFVFSLYLRLYSLGDRAIHHDESLHGYFSHQMYIGNGYEHNPLMHGVFLFQLVSLSFFIFGDSEFSLRFPMALIGSLMIFLPILLRDRIGSIGAILSSIMITLSPSILYFSRFARNDIFMLFISLLLVIAMWKYFTDKQSKWLYLFSIFLALGFLTKETQYIFVMIISIYLLIIDKENIKNWLFGKIPLTSISIFGKFLIFVMILSIPMFSAGFSIFQNVFNLTLANNNTSTLTPIGLPESNGQLVAIIITFLLLIFSLFTSLLFNKKIFFIPFIIFISLIFLFYSNFLSNLSGISTGVWQSLGYWIAQQDVARGSQPWYYYITLGSIYEFLPMSISILGLFYFTIRSRFLSFLPLLLIIFSSIVLSDVEASYTNGIINLTGVICKVLIYSSLIFLPFTLKVSNFYKFLFFWAISSFVLYTYAGEKMPWLITNITLPFIILSSKLLNDFFSKINFSQFYIKYYIAIFFSSFLFMILFWRLLTHDLGSGFVEFLNIWLIFMVIGLIFFSLQWISTLITKKQTFIFIIIPILLMMSIFSFRSMWILNFNNYDTPKEMMIYTQTSPHLHNVSDTINSIAFKSLEGKSIRISVDTTDAFSWPWQWYLRDYNNVTFDDHSQKINLEDVSILILNHKNDISTLERNDFTQVQKFPHRWWFPEKYRNINFIDITSTIFDRNRWGNPLDYFLYRNLDYDLGSIDSYLYIKNDLYQKDFR